jgi:hypothetical protein
LRSASRALRSGIPGAAHVVRLSSALHPRSLPEPGCATAVPSTPFLYRIIRQHSETDLGLTREDDCDREQVATDVERECRHDLECGILAHGFTRAHCPQLFS